VISGAESSEQNDNKTNNLDGVILRQVYIVVIGVMRTLTSFWLIHPSLNSTTGFRKDRNSAQPYSPHENLDSSIVCVVMGPCYSYRESKYHRSS